MDSLEAHGVPRGMKMTTKTYSVYKKYGKNPAGFHEVWIGRQEAECEEAACFLMALRAPIPEHVTLVAYEVEPL